MATSICPGCASQVKPGDLICFTCGTNLPPGSGTEDFPVPTTIMQETLAPDQVRRAASLAMLRLAFPTGNVEVPAGTSLLLGRDPGHSLVAAAFSGHDNVSRRHATVAMDDDGHAFIWDHGSTNGTFVNDDRVLPGIRVRLANGDQVRLGGDLSAEVQLLRAEADPALFSRDTTPTRGMP